MKKQQAITRFKIKSFWDFRVNPMSKALTFLYTILLWLPSFCAAQNGQASSVILSYDHDKPEAKPEIPFDKWFTMQVLHLNIQALKHVYVFETGFADGVRTLKSGPKGIVYDFSPGYKIRHDTLNLYFRPVKPSRDFDIIVVRGLTLDNMKTLLKLNEAVVDKDSDQENKLLTKLRGDASDQVFHLSYFNVKTVTAYETLFESKFRPSYNRLTQESNFPEKPFPTMECLNLMNAGFVEKGIKFKWGYFMVRTIKEAKTKNVFAGRLPADYNSTTKFTTNESYQGRITNLDKSIAMMDTVYRYVNTFLFKENDADFEYMRMTLQADIEQMKLNKKFLEDELDGLSKAIQAEEDLSEAEVLTNSTVAKDLKTQGNNIFTLDLGLAGISTWNSRNQATFLPKIYYGVNIYFRPIDKNTRRETMPKNLKPNYTEGPDYNIAAQESMWQKVSMTVGFTTGGYADQDFANLYNNTSLLLGFGYRFKYGLKATAGTSLMRRVSNNPVITSKSVCFAPFVSMSVDLDLIQGLKDLYTNLIVPK